MRVVRLSAVFSLFGLLFWVSPLFAACGSDVFPTSKEQSFYANSAQAIEDVETVAEGLLNHGIIEPTQFQRFQASRELWRSGYNDYLSSFEKYQREIDGIIQSAGTEQADHCSRAEQFSKNFVAARVTLQRYTDSIVLLLRDIRSRKWVSKDPLSAQQFYLKLIGRDNVALPVSMRPVIVAIIDDGVFINHEDLNEHLWANTNDVLGNRLDDDQDGFVDDVYGYDFLSNNGDVTARGTRGTHIAGIISAMSDNSIGIQGIALNARIMSLVACDSKGLCDPTAVSSAIRFAVDHGAKIVQIPYSSTGTPAYTDAYNSSLLYAYEHDVLVIAPAGNAMQDVPLGTDLDTTPLSPACNNLGRDIVLGVGAVNDYGLRTSWTNFGAKCVDVYAPGDDILSTGVPMLEHGQAYTTGDGTSYSAAVVTGIATLLKGIHPEMNPKELTEHIKSTGWQQVVSLSNAIGTMYSSFPIVLSTQTTSTPSTFLRSEPPIASVPSQKLSCGNHQQLSQSAHSCICVAGYVRDSDTHACRKDVFVGTPKTKAQYGKCDVIAIVSKHVWYLKGNRKLTGVMYKNMECYASTQMAELFGFRRGK